MTNSYVPLLFLLALGLAFALLSVGTSLVVGPKRYKVYGQMDIDLMKQVAPLAATRTYNNRYFFSNRINPKSLVYQGIYQDFDWASIALK